MGFTIRIAFIAVDDAGRNWQQGQAFRPAGLAPVDFDPAFAVVGEKNILRRNVLHHQEGIAGKASKEEYNTHKV